ncbi:MAG TPA: UbiA-like polyprenyltransferase [Bacteroidales bacterium]|nr:UbiA-like polyprenyltransferase [Bacteroidales bacterium]
MFTKIKSYFSLIKFSHTVFAMPFAFLGFSLAILQEPDSFEWASLVFVILCMIFARNTAMSFNRFCDRDIDKKNPRTTKREIPSGKISLKNSIIFTIINAILFIICSGFFNKTTLFLSPVALFIILFYSYTKRFTFLSHFVLGISLAIAPAGAYLAITGHLDFAVIILSVCVFLWTAGFDILYSLQDEEFDKANNLFSIPARFGRVNSLVISALVHFICSAGIIYINILLQAGYLMWTGTAIFIALLIYQHLIIKKHDISRINLAFGTLNGIASVIYASLAIIEIFYTA